MIYELLLVSMPLFWLILAIPLVILILASEFSRDDCPGVHIFTLFATAVVLVCLTNVPSIIVSISWKYWVAGTLAYILAGACYSLFRFYRLCSKSLLEYEAAKARQVNDKFSNVAEWVKRHREEYIIDPADNKTRILDWMGFWVFCIARDCLQFFFQGFWAHVYDLIAGVYTKISKHFESQIK